MPGAVIGSVAVGITPDAQGFIDKMKAQIIPGAGRLGDEFGRDFGRSAGDAAASAIAAALAGLPTGPAGESGHRAGSAFADKFDTVMRERINAAARALGPRIRVDADTDPATRQMEELRRKIRETEAHLRIGRIDDATAIAQIDEIRKQLAELGKSSTSARVKLNTAEARAELDQLKASLAGIGSAPAGESGRRSGAAFADKFSSTIRERINAATHALGTQQIRVDADTDPATRSLAELRRELRTLGNKVRLGALSDEEAVAQVDKLKAKLAALGKSTTSPRIRANTAEAEAELAKLKAELAAVNGESKAPTNNRHGGAFKPILDAALFLGPALIPITTAVAGVFGAAVIGAGALALAANGAKRALAEGTTVGLGYAKGIGAAKKEINNFSGQLAKTALPYFNAAVRESQRLLPQLDGQLQTTTRRLGSAFDAAIQGSLVALIKLGPATSEVTRAVDAVAHKFEAWASGPGGSAFAARIAAALPEVGRVLGEVAQALGRIVAAAAPLGGVTLHAIGAVAAAINAIPIPVLTAMIAVLQVARLVAIGKALTGVALALKATTVAAAQKFSGSLIGGLLLGNTGGVLAQTATRLGAVALAIAAVYAASKAFNSSSIGQKLNNLLPGSGLQKAADDAKSAGKNYQGALDAISKSEASFTDALTASNGTVDASVLNLAGSLSKVYGLAGLVSTANSKGAVSQAQFAKGVTGTSQAYDDLLAKIKAYDESFYGDKKTGDAQFSSQKKELDALRGSYQQAKIDAEEALAAIALANQLPDGTIPATTTDVAHLANAYKLTSDQITTYAGVLGITFDKQGLASASANQLQAAVYTVSQAYKNANTAQQPLLDSLAKFSASAGTAADRADLIQSTLRSADGDGIGYAASINDAAVANQNLVDAFSATNKAGATAISQFVDLKTGAIDYSNAGAQPMISALQQLQDAALKAAGATYQHEQATKGGKKAAADAYDQYIGQTRNALIDEAMHFGLTTKQAKAFADQYFKAADAPNIKKQIMQEGGDTVARILTSILTVLQQMAGIVVKPTVELIDHATGRTEVIKQAINSITGKSVTITTVYDSITKDGERHSAGSASGTAPSPAPASRAPGGKTYALGGHVKGPGTGTSDSIPALLSNGEFIVNAKATAMNRAALEAINARKYAAGGYVNPFDGVIYGRQLAKDKKYMVTGGSTGTGSKSKATKSKAGKPLTDAQLYGPSGTQTLELQGAGDIVQAIISNIRQRQPLVVAAVGDLARAMSDAFNLRGVNTKVAVLSSQLKSLTSAAAQMASQVSSSLLSTFNVGSAGAGPTGYVTGFSAVLSDFKAQQAKAAAFTSELTALRAKGLNGTLLAQYAQAGPSSTVDALAKGSKAQIAQINKAYAGITGSVNQAGRVAADAVYGKSIQATQKQLNQQVTLQRALTSDLNRYLKAASALEHRPIEVKLDGHVIARAVQAETVKAARR